MNQLEEVRMLFCNKSKLYFSLKKHSRKLLKFNLFIINSSSKILTNQKVFFVEVVTVFLTLKNQIHFSQYNGLVKMVSG